MSPFSILLELRMMDVVVATAATGRAKLQLFLQPGCPSVAQPTVSMYYQFPVSKQIELHDLNHHHHRRRRHDPRV